jgi:hypothetical protein
MKTRDQTKRIARIEDKLRLNLPADTNGATLASYWLCNLRDLSSAVERAKRVGAHNVVFVPLSGAVQYAEWEQKTRGTPAIVTAFEGPPDPTNSQIQRLANFFDPTYPVTDDNTRPAKPRGERVTFSRGDQLLCCLSVSPEELPWRQLWATAGGGRHT